MNRTTLVTHVSARTGLSAAASREVVDAVVDGITRGLVEDGRVQLPGFGTLEVQVVPSRWVRNPATGKKVKAAKNARGKFRAATAMREYATGRKKLPK